MGLLFQIVIYLIIAYIIVILGEIPNLYKRAKKEANRKILLQRASLYLEPYSDLWKYQKLKNDYLEAELRYQVIIIRDNIHTLKIKTKRRNDIDYYWDIILVNFDGRIMYDNLSEKLINSKICNKFNVDIIEKIKKKKQKSVKIDINNCSEYMLTKLAGINIIIAKRILKKREEAKGFKTKEEFYNFVQLKPHLVKNIDKQIEIKRMKILKPLKINKERIIDL